MLRFVLLAAVPAAFTLSAALAQPAPVQAQNVWARATPPRAAAAAVYITLTSPGGDTLTGVSTPAAKTAQVHEMRMDGTVMRMRALDNGLELPAGKTVTLAPGGYHIMLEGLKAPLKAGETVPLHLTFRNAPPLDVKAEVRSMSDTGRAGAAPMPGMNMGH